MAKIIRKKSTVQSTAQQVESSISKTTERRRKAIDVSELIPSPSIPFNLECSGHIEGAFQKGKIINLIGDSHAGKTLFALSIFAVCSQRKEFDSEMLVTIELKEKKAELEVTPLRILNQTSTDV